MKKIFNDLQFVRDAEQEGKKSTTLLDQLQEIWQISHFEYWNTKNSLNDKEESYGHRHKSKGDLKDNLEEPNKLIDKTSWANGTVLIMGDSTLNSIQEKLMGSRFKVRVFPGAIVWDFYHNWVISAEGPS